jgi:phosphatidylserine decarboxylase
MPSGARHVDTDPAHLTSPVDGTVLASGMFQDIPLQTLTIKDRLYTIEDLLGTDERPAGFGSGAYVLFYLAPGDYHRFHSPLDGLVTGWDYLPGTCHPVNRIGRRLFPDLYVTNRRVVLWMETQDDPPLRLYLVLIGAMGVGRIAVDIDGLHIAGEGGEERHVRLDVPARVGRGDDLGRFDLGSSVLVVCSAADHRTTIIADEGPIRLGMPVISVTTREIADV